MAAIEEAVRGVGHSVKRIEDARFLHGRGNYFDDISLPGMLHLELLRSPYAHARIKSIDTSKAEAVEGVVAEDLPLGALLHGRSPARADEQHEVAARQGPQQPLDRSGAQEARAAGDRDARAVEGLPDHPPLSTIW